MAWSSDFEDIPETSSRLIRQAGEGEDGRMKSAIGIGALLMDGLGDTIRVSLTEDPELEIDPCRCLSWPPPHHSGCGPASSTCFIS